eukprot:jgi/Bigna1/126350/aug1.2_g1058
MRKLRFTPTYNVFVFDRQRANIGIPSHHNERFYHCQWLALGVSMENRVRRENRVLNDDEQEGKVPICFSLKKSTCTSKDPRDWFCKNIEYTKTYLNSRKTIMGYINISPPSGLQRNKGESGGGSDAATAAALAPLSKGRAHISLACYGTEITDEILKRGKKCISSGNSKIDKKKNNGRSRKSESTTPTDSAKKGRQRRKSSSKRR